MSSTDGAHPNFYTHQSPGTVSNMSATAARKTMGVMNVCPAIGSVLCVSANNTHLTVIKTSDGKYIKDNVRRLLRKTVFDFLKEPLFKRLRQKLVEQLPAGSQLIVSVIPFQRPSPPHFTIFPIAGALRFLPWRHHARFVSFRHLIHRR